MVCSIVMNFMNTLICWWLRRMEIVRSRFIWESNIFKVTMQMEGIM